MDTSPTILCVYGILSLTSFVELLQVYIHDLFKSYNGKNYKAKMLKQFSFNSLVKVIKDSCKHCTLNSTH